MSPKPFNSVQFWAIRRQPKHTVVAENLIRRGITAVLDLTAEFSEAPAFRALAYRNIQVLDLTAPTVHQLREVAAFIEEHSERGVVYVHCKIGYSRSAAAAAAYLLQSGQATSVEEALSFIRARRPKIVVRPEIAAVLNEFARPAPVSPRLSEALLQ